jgi:hypothetical protein
MRDKLRKSEKYIIKLIVFFWAVTPCSPVDGYQRFGGKYSFHLQSSTLELEEISSTLKVEVIVPPKRW